MSTAFLTLLSHYRRHPGQLAMLLVGLWVASALWSGVQAINATARDSYARAEGVFSAQLDRLERRDGQAIALEEYLALRLAGAPVSPLVEGRVALGDDSRLEVVGIDALTLPEGSGFRTAGGTATLTDFLQPPYLARAAPETETALWRDGMPPRLADGRPLPPAQSAPELPPGLAVMDIAAALALLERDGIDHLLLPTDATLALPDTLVRVRAEQLASPGQLTDSFHLNLTAMGLLTLVVGLFIVHAALGLALEQRLGLLRTLRALGVSGRMLVGLLLFELLIIGAIGAVLGIASGVWLAAQLLPDVAASLGALYGEQVGTGLALPWHYWLGGLGVTLGGLFTAASGTVWRAARLNILGLGQAQAWRARFQRQLRLMALFGALMWLAAFALWLWLRAQPPAEGLVAGFMMVAAGLLAAALWLPPLLAATLGLAGRALRRYPLAQWALADLQLQLPRLALAMMALLIALTANLGVGSMVGGFRLTFLEWLDQRLVADLYLNPDTEQHDAIVEWLAPRPEIATLLPRRSTESTLLAVEGASVAERPVSLYSLTPEPPLTDHWPLLETLDDSQDAWRDFIEGAALINEQLAYATGLAPGARITLATPEGAWETHVTGIYPDYGNPRGEVTLSDTLLAERFAAPPGSIGVVLAPNLASSEIALLRRALAQRFALGEGALIDQQAVKRQARDIFERTFTITYALNGLTLGVAGLALLSSLLAQGRQRRAQLAPLWALGASRARLVTISVAQLGGAALLTALLAIPLGIALTWGLVAVINVAAFGWRLPLTLFPQQMALTLLLALGVAWFAALLPAWRLMRTPPRELLAEFEAS
ncbi:MULTISPECIES: ABC transporter permease [Halomonadaceae]|uniref:ABC transporter permease n=1 Tax=Halomonadaceae TaxID=28256 RepID=UPI00159B61BA|nr:MULTISPECIES: ABC transporter permease [Halomonas]QJQ93877.1 ABC transporter permease [Halomonas sp. PA5]